MFGVFQVQLTLKMNILYSKCVKYSAQKTMMIQSSFNSRIAIFSTEYSTVASIQMYNAYCNYVRTDYFSNSLDCVSNGNQIH